MRVHVAFTPVEVLEAPVAVVVDVMRATSTIAQALASGYERVWREHATLFAELDAPARAAILGGTAARAYRIAPPVDG